MKSIFSQLENLEILYLSTDENMDNILNNLSQCKKLKILRISNCKITEIGFKCLITMTNLTSLDVSRTDITDELLVN